MPDGETNEEGTWVAVLGPDATVLAVSGAPLAWVGTRLDRRDDVSEKVRVPRLFTRDQGALHTVGVALMLVHDVVTAHGGSVTVTSSTDAYDHGTTVTLRFPVR